MGLLEEFESETATPKGPRCETCKLLASMSDEDADDLRTALAKARNAEIEFEAISRVLERRGYTIGAQSLSRHTRRKCVGG